tara:strand:- start:5285 stop:5965 length:681 start_codon:yes stop_codon:yes gene_type:complete
MTETNYFDLIEYIAKIKSNNNKSIWKLNNNDLYNKFTQYVEFNDELVEEESKNQENKIENEKKSGIDKEKNDEKIQKNKEIENQIPEKIHEKIHKNKEIDTENKNINNSSKNKKKLIESIESTKLEIKNKIKVLPLELLCNELNLMISENTNNYIKTKITNNLEDKKYIKVFGVKKTAEIVSGIVNNKWNISLVLFISFLLDKKFIYLKKEILYNKELQSYDTITI